MVLTMPSSFRKCPRGGLLQPRGVPHVRDPKSRCMKRYCSRTLEGRECLVIFEGLVMADPPAKVSTVEARDNAEARPRGSVAGHCEIFDCIVQFLKKPWAKKLQDREALDIYLSEHNVPNPGPILHVCQSNQTLCNPRHMYRLH